MPPQVTKAEPGPTVPQAPPPEIQKDESKDVAKSTSSSDTSGVKTQANEAKSGTPAQQKKEPEDPKATARAAQGSKQNATEHKSQNNIQAQIVKKNLQKQVPNRDSGSVYESMKNAAEVVAVRLPAAAKATAEAIAENGADGVRQKQVEKLHKNQYPQDMVRGELFVAEKITPGNTDKTKTIERVEDRSRGDVASRKYHQEQHRTSTQSGLKDRLQELNQGKDLTAFEKGLVSKWDPQMKEGGITAVSPIMGLDSTGTKGPTEAYKVQKGLETTYYDRNGNIIEPESRQQKIEKLDRRQYSQDMVRGELFVVETINPGNTNQTKTREHADNLGLKDIQSRNFHPTRSRTATQSGLDDRLKELNPGKELTPFEKGMVSEWDMKQKGDKDPITNLSPIMEVDSSGKKGPNEVQAYKVQRGIETTYYDRNGNVLKDRWARGAGQAVQTNSPIDYASLAYAGTKFLGKKALQFGEEFLAKETASITKAETGAIVRSAEQQVTKAETGAATRTAEKEVMKAETGTVVRSGEKRIASGTDKAGVTTHNTSWRQGSGTSVHVKPNATAGKLTEAEQKAIKEFQEAGMSAEEAMDVIRATRGAENTVEVVLTNVQGTTRHAWKNSGGGKKTP